MARRVVDDAGRDSQCPGKFCTGQSADRSAVKPSFGVARPRQRVGKATPSDDGDERRTRHLGCKKRTGKGQQAKG